MKTGDRVICIKIDNVSIQDGEIVDCPKIDEVITIQHMSFIYGIKWLHFEEYTNGISYNSVCFRKTEKNFSNATTKELAGWAKEHVEQERTPKKIRIFTTEAEF